MAGLHGHRHQLVKDDVPSPTRAINGDPVVIDALPTETTLVLANINNLAQDMDVPDEIAPTQSIDIDDIVTETELAAASGEASASVSLDIAGDRPTTTALTVPTPSSSADTSTDNVEEGMTTGAKAGIAFGVIGGALLIGLIIFFITSKRRKSSDKDHMEDGGEKHGASGVAPVPPPKAPRLSLRPVTQFFPNFDFNGKNNGRNLAPPPNNNPFERPDTSQSQRSVNPFGAGAERVPSPISERSIYSTQSPALGGLASPAQANAPAAFVTRKASLRSGPSTQKNLPLRPVSPVGSEYSMSSFHTGKVSALSDDAPTPPTAPPKMNVHRVQLDFKPTLADEMELRPGDLVQLLHEYDDGWVSSNSPSNKSAQHRLTRYQALCVRLDKSKQGVVPRTCLSTRPVKPRPAQGTPGSVSGPRPGPPGNSNAPRGPGPNNPPSGQRPITPQGMPGSPGRPRAGTGSRPNQPSALRTQPQMGRPMSPAGMQNSPRSQSPARHGPGRPQSPSGLSRQVASPGPSPMNPFQDPKPSDGPLPGQAL